MMNHDNAAVVGDSDVALYRREPRLAAALPRAALGRFPTPVERVELLTPNGPIAALIKRDDLCADGYAGNKLRKLEFLLADAQARGCGRLITAGATGSHHAFATAFHGRRLGFDVSLVLFPQSRTPHVREMLLLDAATGAELRWASRVETLPFHIWRARQAWRADRPCMIPPGGSSDLGTVGYVNGALELADQIAAGVIERPREIHVAAGTLGTTAGIAIGLAWAGLDIPVAATRITPRFVTNGRVLASLVRSTVRLLRSAGATTPDPAAALRLVTLRHDQLGRGYGQPTPAGDAAAAVFAQAGLTLDPTYTAKAAASLLEAGQGAQPPLFWHTLSAIVPRDLAEVDASDRLPPPFTRYLERP